MQGQQGPPLEPGPAAPGGGAASGRSLGQRLGMAFVVLVALGLIFILAYGFVAKGSPDGGIRLSRSAPDFTIELFDGGTFTLSEARGHPVVVNFWASWCDSCREEMPVLEAGWRRFKDQGVIFVGVNVMDSREDALRMLEEFDITYANGPDPGNKIYARYGVTGVPETFFITADGIIVRKYMGPLKEDQLNSFTEAILP